MNDQTCGRRYQHRRHTYVNNPTDPHDHDCDGRPRPPTVPEILARRPDLADVTPVAVIVQIQVMCA